MPIVTGKNQRWRVLGAHAFLILLLVVTLFPLDRKSTRLNSSHI